MKIQPFLQTLASMSELRWALPDGSLVPAHAHVTEVALMTRRFVDCGGTHRMERRIQLQLWVANDVDHRLDPSKLLRIIRETEAYMEWDNHEVEIEYQGKTIERYGVEIMEGVLALQPLQTNCLAQDRCGLPMLEETSNSTRTVEETVPQPKSQAPVVGRCKPGSGCC
jgi:hypothetical protein